MMTSAKNKREKRVETVWRVDNGGGIEQEYFKKIYKRPEFVKVFGDVQEPENNLFIQGKNS